MNTIFDCSFVLNFPVFFVFLIVINNWLSKLYREELASTLMCHFKDKVAVVKIFQSITDESTI